MLPWGKPSTWGSGSNGVVCKVWAAFVGNVGGTVASGKAATEVLVEDGGRMLLAGALVAAGVSRGRVGRLAAKSTGSMPRLLAMPRMKAVMPSLER